MYIPSRKSRGDKMTLEEFFHFLVTLHSMIKSPPSFLSPRQLLLKDVMILEDFGVDCEIYSLQQTLGTS